MLKKTLIAASTFGLAVLVGGYAQAQQQSSTTFNNNFGSRLIVSPAQLYQTQDLKTDFGLTYGAAGSEEKPSTGSVSTFDTTTTRVFASGIYNISPIGLRAGLQANYLDGSVESEYNDVSSEGDLTQTVITPVVAYVTGPISIGAGVDITQRKQEDAKVSYNTFKTGVLWAQDQLEAGIAYRAPQNIIGDADKDELSANYAAEVLLHGRYAIQPGLTVGGIVKNEAWKSIDEDKYKDRIATTVTTEYTLGATKIEGDLGYKTAYYKEKEFLTSSTTIATWDLGVGADYSINDKSTVGGVVGYEFGSDKANEVEYAANELTVGVRGNVRF